MAEASEVPEVVFEVEQAGIDEVCEHACCFVGPRGAFAAGSDLRAGVRGAVDGFEVDSDEQLREFLQALVVTRSGAAAAIQVMSPLFLV
jgi:hypothetical protein